MGHTIIINQSRLNIIKANIDICKQHFEFSNLKPNERFTIRYKAKGDCYHVIIIYFSSGKKLRTKTGYVTSGHKLITYTISVTNSDISIIDLKFE